MSDLNPFEYPAYVIVTPAYNEARYITATIESVAAQTIRPRKWIIVDDGSTDATGELIRQYAACYPWIEYVYRPKVAGQSYYGSNVEAIREGVRAGEGLAWDYLAILDADISLPKDYYETMLRRLERDPRLGIASGIYVDRLEDGRFRKACFDRRSTPKALMVFRRQCYEEIGGFVPMKYGGEDTVACGTARMKGWKTWSFPDVTVIHNKPIGTGHGSNILKIRFRNGLCEWGAATHPLFMTAKCLSRCAKEYPLLVSGFARLCGFFYGCIVNEKRQIPDALVAFIRREQRQRLFHGNRIPVQVKFEMGKGDV